MLSLTEGETHFTLAKCSHEGMLKNYDHLGSALGKREDIHVKFLLELLSHCATIKRTARFSASPGDCSCFEGIREKLRVKRYGLICEPWQLLFLARKYSAIHGNCQGFSEIYSRYSSRYICGAPENLEQCYHTTLQTASSMGWEQMAGALSRKIQTIPKYCAGRPWF